MRPATRFRLSEEAGERLRTLHPRLKQKIRSALDAIARDPHAGKALHARLAGLRSMRVGRLRIVYRLGAARNEPIQILVLGPRTSIYDETERLLREQLLREPTLARYRVRIRRSSITASPSTRGQSSP